MNLGALILASAFAVETGLVLALFRASTGVIIMGIVTGAACGGVLWQMLRDGSEGSH